MFSTYILDIEEQNLQELGAVIDEKVGLEIPGVEPYVYMTIFIMFQFYVAYKLFTIHETKR